MKNGVKCGRRKINLDRHHHDHTQCPMLLARMIALVRYGSLLYVHVQI